MDHLGLESMARRLVIRVPIGHDRGLRPLVPSDVGRYRTLVIYLRPGRELAGLALLHTTRLN